MASLPHTVRLGSPAGIPIRLHWSWPIVAGLVLAGFWTQLRTAYPDLGDAAAGGLAALGTVLLFASVLLHELAHALAARRRGIEVSGITLYLFGGATEADASSRSPADELFIAIVGPATSVMLGAILGTVAMVLAPLNQSVGELFGYLAVMNVVLAVFNMVPGLPLDGGRVFRATAWAITGDFAKATRWATTAGVIVGYSLIGFGLLAFSQGMAAGLWSAAIGWVISQSAKSNERQEELRSTFEGLTAGDVMTSPVVTIPAGASVAEVVRDYYARRNESVFPVVDGGGQPLGLITAGSVRDVPTAQIWQTPVERLASQHQPALVAEPSTPMLEVIAALSSASGSKARVLVVDNGRLVGIISPADVFRRQALRELIDRTEAGRSTRSDAGGGSISGTAPVVNGRESR